MVIFMVRLVLVSVFLVLFLILSMPVMLAEWIIGKYSPSLRSRSSLAIVKWALGCIKFLSGVKVDYIGEENVPTDTPVLYIGNHRSYFDIILTYIRVPRPTGYIAKNSMERIPLLRIWMRGLHCLFLDRENLKAGAQTIIEAVKLMKSGISMCIFPEGTRNKEEGTLLPFHEGSFKIAAKSDCPIIPMTIVNSAAVFESHLPWIKKAHVIIEYGEPIYISELPKERQKKVASYVQGIILETYNRNKANI